MLRYALTLALVCAASPAFASASVSCEYEGVVSAIRLVSAEAGLYYFAVKFIALVRTKTACRHMGMTGEVAKPGRGELSLRVEAEHKPKLRPGDKFLIEVTRGNGAGGNGVVVSDTSYVLLSSEQGGKRHTYGGTN